MLISLGIPVIALMALAVLVTRLIERWTPESMAGLAITLAVSVPILWALSSAGFALMYLWRGVELEALFGTSGGLAHFLTLGAKSALIWGPICLLVVVTAPRRWKEAVW